MFGFLKELIASRPLEKVLVREEARHPITKHVNSISLIKMEEEKSVENNKVIDKNIVEPNKIDVVEPIEEVDGRKEVEDDPNDEPVRSVKEELTGEKVEELVKIPRSQPVGYYLKHKINEKFIEGLIDKRKDENKPFILGRPILTMTKEMIRLDKGTITLKSSKNKINFFKRPESLCRVEKETKNDIDLVALTNISARILREFHEERIMHEYLAADHLVLLP
ncbi:hypothetical protein Tco_0658795 [Tanacetum coccineum]